MDPVFRWFPYGFTDPEYDPAMKAAAHGEVPPRRIENKNSNS